MFDSFSIVSGSFHIPASIVGGLPTNYTRHIWVDVEPTAGAQTFDVVFRGQDKFVMLSGDNTPDKPDNQKRCAQVFNDATGAPRAFILARTADKGAAETVAAQIIAFYSAPIPKEGEDAKIAERIAAVTDATARELIHILAPVLGYNGRKHASRRVGSFHAAAAEARSTAVSAAKATLSQTAAKVAQVAAEDPAALAEATTDDELAALKLMVANIEAAKARK